MSGQAMRGQVIRGWNDGLARIGAGTAGAAGIVSTVGAVMADDVLVGGGLHEDGRMSCCGGLERAGKPHRPGRIDQRRGSVLLLAAGVLLAAGLLSGWLLPDSGAAPARAASPAALGAAAAAEDTAALLAGASAAYAGAPAVTLRFCSVDLGPAAASRAAGEAAAQQLGLRAAGTAAPDGGAAYRAEGEAALGSGDSAAPSGRATLLLAGSGDGASSFLIVKLEASSRTKPEALLDWQRDTAQRLAALGMDGAWNATLQGELAPGREPQAALATLAQAFHAQPLETYRDNGTYSVSYSTKQLSRKVRSGSHDIALQTALHRDTTSGAWRLTVGTPIITSEY